MIPLHQHPLTLPPPVGAGHARPARFPPPPVTALYTPSHPYIVGRGLDPSAARRGRRLPTKIARNHPTPAHLPASTRSPFCHPVGAGHARPATSPPPAVNLPPLTHSPKPSNPATFLPPTTPIICTRQPSSPQYTPCPNFALKLCRKNQKNLQKPVDKGHTTCYNNQAVSRAQPAAAAAGAFTYSLYTVF